MPEPATSRPLRTCPHCGKEIANLTPKPRDLGLLLNVLLYRVPYDKEITPVWVEVARKHCRMKPERLAELQQGDHARHWRRMLARRAARFAYFTQHGKLPPRDAPLLPGEPDRGAQLDGFARYRYGGLAKLKARTRRKPEAINDKLTNRYLATRRIRSRSRQFAVSNDLVARLAANLLAKSGKLTLEEYEQLRMSMLADEAFPRRFRRKEGPTGCQAEETKKTARGEPGPEVPSPDPASPGAQPDAAGPESAPGIA